MFARNAAKRSARFMNIRFEDQNIGILPPNCSAFSKSTPFAPIAKAMSLLRMERRCISDFRLKKTSIFSVSRISPIGVIAVQHTRVLYSG